MRNLIWLAVGLSLAGAPALAECVQPNPPPPASRPKRPQPPAVPVCAGVKNCTRVDEDVYNKKADAYETAVSVFKRDADAYVNGLKAYAEAAFEYAKCEAQRLDQEEATAGAARR